ncbi:MAG: hypothetical protein QNL05_03575 [Gammaproteobacteria bacterium]|nr:hypothetical protein [Gammaproteobacteria bacterium]
MAGRMLQCELTETTSRKAEVKATITNLRWVSAKEKAKQIEYLDKFFRKTYDEERMISSIETSCHP